jgi:hypothetical protein
MDGEVGANIVARGRSGGEQVKVEFQSAAARTEIAFGLE